MCNSACGYLFLGATTREVAPDAAIAVHNSRLTLLARGPFSAQQIAEFKQRSMARADRERAAFVVAMGISRELDDLIKTVKFESLHILTRAELYRFGIDTRPLPETAWTLEAASRPYSPQDRRGQTGRRRFVPDDGVAAVLREQGSRPADVRAGIRPGAGGLKTMMLTAGPDKSVAFGRYPARVGKVRGVERYRRARCHAGNAGSFQPAHGRGHARRGGQDKARDVRHRYAWPRRIMDTAPVFVPGQHRPACGGVVQSQRASRTSGNFRCSRDAGEVSARARNQ
jgi:hypothetical protein